MTHNNVLVPNPPPQPVLKLIQLTDVLCVRACVRACVHVCVCERVYVCNVHIACLASCDVNCMKSLLLSFFDRGVSACIKFIFEFGISRRVYFYVRGSRFISSSLLLLKYIPLALTTGTCLNCLWGVSCFIPRAHTVNCVSQKPTQLKYRDRIWTK